MKAPGTCSSLCSAEYLPSTTTAARSSSARRWTWKGEGAVGQAGGEVLQALALDRGEQRTLVGPDRVVTGGERDPLGRDVPPREAVRVALPGIDEDSEAFGQGSATGHPCTRVRRARRLLRLPEDRRATPDLGEDELRAEQARPVKDQVDRRPPVA